MSREIPDWLQHLKRDRRGLPVPYINLWGEEDEARTDVRWDSNVGMEGVFLDDSAEEVPDFTRQHIARQRECMSAGLCQVCGRSVPWSRRTLVIADLSVEWIDLHGRPHMALIEPWLCERCARFAVDVCPALIRRTRAEHLRVVKVPSKRFATMVLSTGWIEGRWEVQTKAKPVAMWGKILLDPKVMDVQ